MNFDLNIDNYTRDELIAMFDLPVNFDRNILDIKESKLRDNIINNKEITSETKEKTINFVIKAKNIILNNYSQKKNGTLQEKIEDFYNSSYDLKTSHLESTDEHMIQVRTQKPYLSSYPSEFFPGVINPLKKRTIKKNLNIDTKFRENYFTSPSTNFNITLPMNMNDIVQMQLATIELPTTYYVVSKQYGNNFFQIIVDGSSSIIFIDDGNYTPITIMDAINNKLNMLGDPFNKVIFILNVINSNTGTGQVLVGENTAGALTSIELNFQTDKNGIEDHYTPLPLKLGWKLGFRNGIYVNNLNYVSEGLVDMTGHKYLYLVVDDHNNNVNNNFYSAFNSSVLNKNILARISIQATAFDILEQNNLTMITTPREYFGPVNIQTLNIQLVDEFGKVVFLNNMDYSFCLTLTSIYDI
jgi:hypothetical protein